MIFNISRLHGFQECRTKAKYFDIDRLVPKREEHALLIGTGTHAGIATILATKNLEKAKLDTEAAYRERVSPDLMPEEVIEHEHNISLCHAMVEKFWKIFQAEPFTVIHPEVEFSLPMPNTLHHCWFAHQMCVEKGWTSASYHDCRAQYFHFNGGSVICDCGESTTQDEIVKAINEGIHPVVCKYCQTPLPVCILPHIFKGKTDAIIMLNGLIWLMEHKTTALAYSLYVRQFQLADQPTGYMYGIWKSLGLKPHGFLLNVLLKPNKQAAKSNPFGVQVEREPFLRSEQDLVRFEREAIQRASDYENAVRTNSMYMDTSSCFNWNRACYYIESCKNHGEHLEGAFDKREDDYVLEEYRKILHMVEVQK